MATLEQIIDEARALSLDEKRKLREVLDLELEQVNAQGDFEPTRGENGSDDTRERRLMWLKSHREEYAGQYVALSGDVLVGHGPTIREAHEQAKQQGIENPFLVRLTSESETLPAGW
jgi:hypothetical protein